MQIIRLGLRDNALNRTACKNPALVQNHQVVAGYDLVEQMRSPQHADTLLGDQPPHMTEDIGARLDIEADGRLVQQQETRPVQQCACNLEPPHLAARKIAHLATRAIGKSDAPEQFARASPRLVTVDAMQGGMILK